MMYICAFVFVPVCVLECSFLQMTEGWDPQVLGPEAVLSLTSDSHACWELNSGPLQGHVLLAAESSSQPRNGLGGGYLFIYSMYVSTLWFSSDTPGRTVTAG